jgi:glycosyltransferase involved in cell wall biosynthesis
MQPREIPRLSSRRSLHAVQVSFHADHERRSAETLLAAWPTVPAIADAVHRAGVRLDVVQSAHQRETLERDGVTYHFVDDTRGMPRRVLGPVRFRGRPTRIIDRVRALNPDVVHVHDFSNPVVVRQLTDALRVPVLVQDHGVVPPRGWRRSAWRWALSGVAGAAFTARHQARPFVERGVFSRGLPVFEVLPASSAFEPGDREAARAKTGIHGDPCFVWTTHLDANKDPDTALTAFEIAARVMPGARLWMAYLRAPLLDDVRRRIRESDLLRERVTLLGARPHDYVQDLLRASDFFLQTSHVEAPNDRAATTR